jgi:hypothetical protein
MSGTRSFIFGVIKIGKNIYILGGQNFFFFFGTTLAKVASPDSNNLTGRGIQNIMVMHVIYNQ